MRFGWIAVLAALAGATAAGFEFAGVRRQLVLERKQVNGAWLQVESALERRAGLTPNLVELVKGFAGARLGSVERDLAQARDALDSGRTPMEKIAANQRLSNALARLLVLTENYPQLRSHKRLLRLEEDIAGSENRIAVERRKYNETLEHYNSSIRMFPENIVAALAGFPRDDAYFHTEPDWRVH